jgi:4-hydroxybenzoate polyprenyltransferase
MGLGEILVGLVWGPVMAGGTFLAMTGTHPLWALLAYAPFAAAVSLVLIGKHMDKYDQDKVKGVGTLTVRLGLRASKLLAGIIAVTTPAAEAGALYLKFRAPLALLPLASYITVTASSLILTREKPEAPPAGWRVWPLWYVAAAYAVMDSVGRGLIAALLSLGLYLAGHTLVAGTIVALAVAWEAANAIPLHRIAVYLEAGRNK